MKHPVSVLVLLSSLSLNVFAAPAPDFSWEPGTVSAKVKVDHDKLKIGQYLYVTHDGSGNEGWNMAKLDLPEAWKIKTVAVDGRIIRVTTENAGVFTITPQNLRKLWSAIRKAGKKPATAVEMALAETWRTVAGAADGRPQ